MLTTDHRPPHVTDQPPDQRAAPSAIPLLARIAQLRGLSMEELRTRWRELFGREPPGYNRAFLLQRLIHRVQELAYGGLKPETRARMETVLDEAGLDELSTRAKPGRSGRTAPRRADTGGLIPGTRLVREWQGARHEVTVLVEGFEYAGRRYRSLTAVADAITGGHWSGLAFFGVRRPRPTAR
jgi:hypothetical protein